MPLENTEKEIAFLTLRLSCKNKTRRQVKQLPKEREYCANNLGLLRRNGKYMGPGLWRNPEQLSPDTLHLSQ